MLDHLTVLCNLLKTILWALLNIKTLCIIFNIYVIDNTIFNRCLVFSFLGFNLFESYPCSDWIVKTGTFLMLYIINIHRETKIITLIRCSYLL